MPKIDVENVPVLAATGYPKDYARIVDGRSKQRLGDAGGLSQYGVNLTRLAPGAASAHRHWHKNEDEFVYVVSGEATLIEDDCECVLRAGEAAAFPAGAATGHHLVNRSHEDVLFLEVGTRAATEAVEYTDPSIDLRAEKDETGWRYLRRDGTPWR